VQAPLKHVWLAQGAAVPQAAFDVQVWTPLPEQVV
jgi:hypothetical protein